MYVNKDVAESDPSIMEYFGVMSRHNPPIRVRGTTRLTGGRAGKAGTGGHAGHTDLQCYGGWAQRDTHEENINRKRKREV